MVLQGPLRVPFSQLVFWAGTDKQAMVQGLVSGDRGTTLQDRGYCVAFPFVRGALAKRRPVNKPTTWDD